MVDTRKEPQNCNALCEYFTKRQTSEGRVLEFCCRGPRNNWNFEPIEKVGADCKYGLKRILVNVFDDNGTPRHPVPSSYQAVHVEAG